MISPGESLNVVGIGREFATDPVTLGPGRTSLAQTDVYERGRDVTPQDEVAATSAQGKEIDVGAEADSYYGHARWLLEWHNKRSDAFASRSTALLGFTGVTLALLVNGITSNEQVYQLHGVRASAALAAGMLLATGFLCMLVLRSRSAMAPSIPDLRTNWHEFMHDPSEAQAKVQLAEDILHGVELVTRGPLDAAEAEASSRGRSFRLATWSAFTSLVVLSGHFVQLVLRA